MAMPNWMTPERLEQGYVIVLPGIEGRSFFNRSIVRGLIDAGVPYGIEIHDWTLGLLYYLYNLRGARRHQQQASEIATKIASYRGNHPGRPVYLIGHSGGGAMALYVLNALPDSTPVTGAILLANAMSRGFDIFQPLRKTERGIWCFNSRVDLFFLAVGTLIFGTIDGKHALCAGISGFQSEPDDATQQPHLLNIPYRTEFLKSRHFAGHFGATGRPFVRRWVAPLVWTPENSPKQSTDK